MTSWMRLHLLGLTGASHQSATAARIERAQETYDSTRRVCRWVALAWMLWSVFWAVGWCFSEVPWKGVIYSFAAWAIGAALILQYVRSDERALTAALDARDAEWAAAVERDRLIREAAESHAQWRDTL